jgi:Protein of unknown function (DUF1822)
MFTTITQWQFEIPDAIDRSAWQQSQTCPNPRAQWNTYLNQLCCDVLLPELRGDYIPTATPYPNAIGSVWEFVSGTGIQGGTKRLVLIPDKSLDRTLSVPQEWVDSPDWAGDYYLAIQIDPDARSLTVWGYATHAMLKTQGEYDADDRAYGLSADQVIQDLNVLWVMQQVNPQEVTQAAIATISPIDPVQAENLLQRLATSDRPRFAIPFALWIACLQQPDWRQQLATLRRGTTGTTRPMTQLNQWLQNIFESGWQALESQLGDMTDTAFALRQTAAIASPAVRRVKALRLNDRLLLLIVAVEPRSDGRLGIQIQVRSGDTNSALPPGLMITLQSAVGEVIQVVEAREADLAVQLQRFRCATGTPFCVQVQWDGGTIEELFMV